METKVKNVNFRVNINGTVNLLRNMWIEDTPLSALRILEDSFEGMTRNIAVDILTGRKTLSPDYDLADDNTESLHNVRLDLVSTAKRQIVMLRSIAEDIRSLMQQLYGGFDYMEVYRAINMNKTLEGLQSKYDAIYMSLAGISSIKKANIIIKPTPYLNDHTCEINPMTLLECLLLHDQYKCAKKYHSRDRINYFELYDKWIDFIHNNTNKELYEYLSLAPSAFFDNAQLFKSTLIIEKELPAVDKIKIEPEKKHAKQTDQSDLIDENTLFDTDTVNVELRSLRGISFGAIHYYADVTFRTFDKTYHSIQIRRAVTDEELKGNDNEHHRFYGYSQGDYINAFNTKTELLNAAKDFIDKHFKNVKVNGL